MSTPLWVYLRGLKMRCGDLTMGLTTAKPFLILKLVDAYRVGELMRSALAGWRVSEFRVDGFRVDGFRVGGLAGSALAS